ncbi:hypothetical protein Dacet_2721 [Denitrovibrio acetiphilus DSM 12809]|uniref:STAS domain-containing protein n=1 Tax=Denitrovibrio acetiphilus (strain DSM 12809 / NBRC 114555 / N2460) TaxID=522772 RepID=D4H5N4_DENA2|nr:hypothetical protein [Denitrovibrio acetiphilus]ADD69475.1 hypothetical protein Dacet_2721 [Denitrovibrio acetiphilus DSM 12809]
MEINELKTKIKIVFPEESEIFMAEEFISELTGIDMDKKPVELDFSGVKTLDTVFIQLALSIIKTVKIHNNKVSIKTSEVLEETEKLYGISLKGLIGGI